MRTAKAIMGLIIRKKSASLSMTSNREYVDSHEWRRLADKVDRILSDMK